MSQYFQRDFNSYKFNTFFELRNILSQQHFNYNYSPFIDFSSLILHLMDKKKIFLIQWIINISIQNIFRQNKFCSVLMTLLNLYYILIRFLAKSKLNFWFINSQQKQPFNDKILIFMLFINSLNQKCSI